MNKKIMSGFIGVAALSIVATPFAVYAVGGYVSNTSSENSESSTSTQIEAVEPQDNIVSDISSQIVFSAIESVNSTVFVDSLGVSSIATGNEIEQIQQATDNAIAQINQVTSQAVETINNTVSQNNSSELTQEQQDFIKQQQEEQKRRSELANQQALEEQQKMEQIRQDQLQKEKEYNTTQPHQLASSSVSSISSTK